MSDKIHTGPRVLNAGRVLVTREIARRVDRIVMRIGRRETAALLCVGEGTLELALEQGTVLTATRDRLLVALEREEGKAAS